MDNYGKQAFIDFVRRLWVYKGEPSQLVFAKELGLSQKTVSNLLSAQDNPNKNFRLDVIDTVARKLKVPSWVLLVPDFPIEKLRSYKMYPGLNVTQGSAKEDDEIYLASRFSDLIKALNKLPNDKADNLASLFASIAALCDTKGLDEKTKPKYSIAKKQKQRAG